MTGNKGPVDPSTLTRLPGVLECIPVTKPYELVSREVHPEDAVIDVGGVRIGGDEPVFIAGPACVETESRTLEVAKRVKAAGARMFCAAAFQPGATPYSFKAWAKRDCSRCAGSGKSRAYPWRPRSWTASRRR